MIGGAFLVEKIISLRQFIESRDQIETVKVQTFCRLMKKVSDAIDKEERNFIRINLDDIKINIYTGDIVFPDELFANADLEKTIAGFNTGISLVAGRKSSKEHKRVSLALMILGWYVNGDKSSVISDITVLENFEYYMSMVPTWLHDYFIQVFKRMNYDFSFSDYYKQNFNDRILSDVKNAFSEYNLNDDQLKRIVNLIMKDTNKMIKEGVQYV